MKRRDFNRISLFLLGMGITNCTNLPLRQPKPDNDDNNALQIWWQEGFYPEETDALKKIIHEWEEKSGQPVELNLRPLKDIFKELKSAIDSGNPPDLFYSNQADLNLIPNLAWNNQLANVADVIEPIKDLYTDKAIAGVQYANKSTGKRSYYGIPIAQVTTHLHYWSNLIEEIGKLKNDIPENWNEYWKFWQESQKKFRDNGLLDIYGIGLPMSPLGNDTFRIFEQFLEAYNVKIIDDMGKILLDRPEQRLKISQALKEYTNFYKNGYVPPDALDWGNADNNVSMLSQLSLMTANPSLSIPASQKQDPLIYQEQMVTGQWPNKPTGEAMTLIVGIRQAIIFEASNKQQVAKDFVSYLIQPENLDSYIKGARGRYFPVMPSLLEDSFWNDPADPHISQAVTSFENTRLPYQVFNPGYSEVESENVWGKVIRKIVAEGLSIDDATNEAIAQIKQILANWT